MDILSTKGFTKRCRPLGDGDRDVEGLEFVVSGILTYSMKDSASAVLYRFFMRPCFHSGRAGRFVPKRDSPTIVCFFIYLFLFGLLNNIVKAKIKIKIYNKNVPAYVPKCTINNEKLCTNKI